MDVTRNILDMQYRISLAQDHAPKDILTKTAIVLVKVLTGVLIILAPIQVVTTALGGCLIAITFGLLTFVLTLIWWPFFVLLMGTSWLWLHAWYLRIILLVPGAFIATLANLYVMLAPEPEKDAKYAKLAITDGWPLSWYLIKPPAEYYRQQVGMEEGLSAKEAAEQARQLNYDSGALESQEEEDKHGVWEIYRKEWATASPEKRAELNKRMRRWQELMNSGLLAQQAYYKAMEEELNYGEMQEESGKSHQPIPAEKKTITKMEKTWKPTAAAILMWISILTSGVVVKLAIGIGFPLYPSAAILSVLCMLGGYYALKRRRYNWAFAGSICSILSMPLLGIPAVILLTNSKREFHIDEKTEKKPRRPLRPRPLFVVSASVVLVLVISLVVYNQISTPTPEPSLEPAPTPETTGVAPIQTATGDLVIEVNENGLSINNNKFNMDSTLDDYIKVLGNPSRVTELMNTIHTYDDAGIRLYQPPDTNRVISVGIDFTNLNYQFSPKHTFRGVLTVCDLSVDSGLHSDSLKAIPNLIVEDTGFGVYSGTFGSIILNFDYRESRERLDSLAISFSEPSGESTEQGEQEIEDGWVRLIIEDVGSIDYPTDFLELSSGAYRDTVGGFFGVLEIEQADFTLQQVGLNEMKPSAFDEYRRVLFRTDYLNPGEEVFRANEKYTASREELAEVKNELIDQLRREYDAKLKTIGQNNRIIDSGSLEIMEVNGMFPMVHTYKRQLNDNPIVLVKAYLFWNYDKIHSLVFSCRVVDEEECRDIYEKMLYSFRLQ